MVQVTLLTNVMLLQGALANTWATINTTSDTARAATLSMVIFAGNCGGLAATWTYIPKLTKAIPKESQIPGESNLKKITLAKIL